jgi:hypothetical protein
MNDACGVGRGGEGTMADKTYSQELQAMIDRAGQLTDEEIESLGRLWKADEDIAFPEPSIALGVVGEVAYPAVTNEQLVAAWENALHAAGNAGRVDEIEAAEHAGRAVARAERGSHDDEFAKDGAAEAVRSAVLATGVRDLITDEAYRTLTAAWQRVVGETTSER